jgi:hypothetical protein
LGAGKKKLVGEEGCRVGADEAEGGETDVEQYGATYVEERMAALVDGAEVAVSSAEEEGEVEEEEEERWAYP